MKPEILAAVVGIAALVVVGVGGGIYMYAKKKQEDDTVVCTNDSGCTGNKACVSGKCVDKCTADSGCSSGQVCADGKCVDGCTSTSCPAGSTCKDGKCVVNCPDCAPEYSKICDGTTCRDRFCNDGDPCPSAFPCCDYESGLCSAAESCAKAPAGGPWKKRDWAY